VAEKKRQQHKLSDYLRKPETFFPLVNKLIKERLPEIGLGNGLGKNFTGELYPRLASGAKPQGSIQPKGGKLINKAACF